MKGDFSKYEIEVIAPNFKKRLSGVTATIANLVPLQAQKINIAATGPGLPEDVPHIPLVQCLFLPRRTREGKPRTVVWHARRNVEMLAGLFLKKICRRPLKLLFTSASQREHTGYTKWLVSKMDSVIATSAATNAYLQKPARVILHGIDLQRFSPVADQRKLKEELGLPTNQRLVGCIGRIRHQKGTDLFVDTMLQLLTEDQDLCGLVIGRATSQHIDFLAELKHKISTAGMADRLLILPEVAVDEIPRYYQALELFIAPQRWEGFGLTPLEAMACGCPVVATRVGAFPELIREGVTGKLVAANACEMKSAATEILGLPIENYQRMRQQARAHMCDAFDLHREADSIIAIYRELLDSHS